MAEIRPPLERGRFITLEGIDGAGKSTHLTWLAELLARRGVETKVTREPGGTELGERLRSLLLAPEHPLHPETETLLMFAARREHLDKVIIPALAQGVWVLCDRFTDASFAYQSAGSGVAWEKVAQLERWVHPDVQPDVTLLLDVTVEVGQARTRCIKKADRFEKEQTAFYQRVREGYMRRAAEAPLRIRRINAEKPLNAIQEELEKIIITL
jgi:dTMP kinase